MASLQKKLIFKKYKVGRLINKTHISSIYEGINKITKEQVAMKFEKIGDKYDFLESETYYLLLLKGIGIPNVISYGQVMNYKVLIEELLGKSIYHIFYHIWKEKDNNKNILNDVCLFALQCLDRLEYIHSKGIVHKDIKPANFILGRKNPRLIYIIDFGTSRKYKSSRTGKHIKFKPVKKINGTMRYMSINACKGYEQSRRDDLESLGYMLIFLMKNYLPWISIEDEKICSKSKLEKVCSTKILTTTKELCKNLPNEFSKYIDYCRELYFEQKPDYNYLRNLFYNILISKEKLSGLNPLDYKSFSWLNKYSPKKIKQISDRIPNINKGKKNGHKRIYSFLKNSVEKKRKQLSTLTEFDGFNSYFNKISYNLSKSVDDKNDKNINSENVISITNDSNIVKKINKSILDNINNNKKISNKKNIKVEKTKLKNFINNNPKLNKKIFGNKMALNKKIHFDLNKKPKSIIIDNQQNDKKNQIRTDNNFNLSKDNILNKRNIKKFIINNSQRANTNYNLPKDQYQIKTNLTNTNLDHKIITPFPNNLNYIKDSSFNNATNNNIKLNNNIHYASLIKRERKNEILKKHRYESNISFLNNFKIEYKFSNTNNFYFNNNSISNRNNYISINKSNDIIDQTNQIYTSRSDEFQNYNNHI